MDTKKEQKSASPESIPGSMKDRTQFLDSLYQRLDPDFMSPAPADRNCIAAVSGGPDSMAMLDLLVRFGYRPAVCHVNYHKRKSADRDECIVRDYCQAHDLPFHLLEPVYEKGNFQGWARDVRRAFFEDTARRYHTNHIYIAHQQDDVLETYLLQKKRGILCDAYGLQKKSCKGNLEYIRPLLQMSKQELQTYCDMLAVPWGLDETNLSDAYLRNQLRHTQIEPMNDVERDQMLQTIEEENCQLAKKRAWAAGVLRTQLPGRWLQDDQAPFLLESWIHAHTGIHLSARMAADLVRQLDRDREVPLYEWMLERWHDQLFIHRQKDLETEPIRIESPEQLQQMLGMPAGNPLHPFRLAQKGKVIESISVQEEDFPLVLVPYEPSDAIRLRYGTKKISRIYMDQKLPHFLRKTRLIVKNARNEVVFVPGTGCDIAHFSPKPSFYMVEF